MLSVESQQIIERLLIEAGLVTTQKLEAYKLQAIQADKPLLAYLSDSNIIDEEAVAKISAKASNVPYVKLVGLKVSSDVMRLMPKPTAESYMAVPFGSLQGKLAIAMLDPTNVQAVDFITRKTGQALTVFMASRASIDSVLEQYRGDVTADVSEAVQSVAAGDIKIEKAILNSRQSAKNVQNLVQDAPITRALNAILDYAVQQHASDIHIEPRASQLKIRYRIDGLLQDTMTLPKNIEPALISRIKILSNLKIDEHRVPQDGQFQIQSSGRSIDLRVAISPVVYGEQVVLRLLDKEDKVLTLDGLGFRGRALRLITEGIHKPHGMTLATGPTGSGKTTSMYAAIQAIRDVSINIVTLEDPIEYKMDSINQIQVNPDVGLTFATGLRSILRQDPNVIMVGEIRDEETADLAVQSALTGHVVLSTLHTNSAAGVLPRLLDMKIEPFLIASTVNTVIGQRLVRQLCPKCKKKAQSNAAEAESIHQTIGKLLPSSENEAAARAKDLGYDNLPTAGQNAYTLYRAVGCAECNKGYRGRIGIYEVFTMSYAIEQLLVQHGTTSQVQAQAEKDGMVTMKQDGYFKALSGLTTLEEVARVAADF